MRTNLLRYRLAKLTRELFYRLQLPLHVRLSLLFALAFEEVLLHLGHFLLLVELLFVGG